MRPPYARLHPAPVTVTHDPPRWSRARQLAWHDVGMTTSSPSPVRHDRIERAQTLMREQGVGAIVILNHDDYRWFFGFDRTQPRAIIPADGAPAVIAFTAEEAEMREAVGDGDVMVWGSVGGQINDVVTRMRAIRADAGQAAGAGFRVAMQQWFETPAFLVGLFKKVNPGVEVVSFGPDHGPAAGGQGARRARQHDCRPADRRSWHGPCPHDAPRRCHGARGSDRGHVRDDAGRGRADEHPRVRQRGSRNVQTPRRDQPPADADRRPRRHRPDADGGRLLRQPRADFRARRAGRAAALAAGCLRGGDRRRPRGDARRARPSRTSTSSPARSWEIAAWATTTSTGSATASGCGSRRRRPRRSSRPTATSPCAMG